MTVEQTRLDETEYAGAMKVRFYTISVENQEANGEVIQPAQLGMRRFQFVNVNVVDEDGEGLTGNYDIDNERLIVTDADGIVDGLDYEVRLTAAGR